MLDDSLINRSIDVISTFDPNFKFRFYLNDTHEYYFDSCVMTCISGSRRLISKIFEKNKHKISDKYQCRTCESITPFAILLNDFRSYQNLMYRIPLDDFKKKCGSF